MSDQPPLCSCGAPMDNAGAIGWYCTAGFECPVHKETMRHLTTPGATPHLGSYSYVPGEDSVSPASESSRPQGLLDEIAELKRIVLRTAEARDDYRSDYFRVHAAYMDFKYPGSRSKTQDKTYTRQEIGYHLKAHATAISELMNLLDKLDVSGEKV